MKTSEFIEYFQNEFCYVKEFSDGIFVTDIDELDLFYLCKDKNSFSTIKFGFESLDFSKQQEYYKVIFDYLMTPIEERKDEKKYYLIMKHDPYSVIQYGEKNNFRVVATSYTKQRLHKYIFTEDEIKDIPDYFKHPAVWEQVEVECGE
ncbi:hypothetical protein [Nosocomiicoccus ampullae]|uniref:hypothetical protein n=1 Tax=Nosocomiicoccus ampullae TaxID=489910 RepID=UPI001C5EFD12|nr:hypothetical protein [Nosocomiicoccus ampullae]QYA47979.1 hypothetical protein KPF52_05850 [Nosocomiicoccus ampullae]